MWRDKFDVDYRENLKMVKEIFYNSDKNFLKDFLTDVLELPSWSTKEDIAKKIIEFL